MKHSIIRGSPMNIQTLRHGSRPVDTAELETRSERNMFVAIFKQNIYYLKQKNSVKDDHSVFDLFIYYI